MRIQLTSQECRWLADLAKKAKKEAALTNEETPHPLFELRRDNMADLESKINAAIQREMQRIRRLAR
jgi:hypothetical protein